MGSKGIWLLTDRLRCRLASCSALLRLQQHVLRLCSSAWRPCMRLGILTAQLHVMLRLMH